MATYMTKISEILLEESVDFNDCDNLQTIAQANNPSLGHKIAQVVCESRTNPVESNVAFTAFDGLICAKYGLFGVLCSLLTYLVSGYTNLDSKQRGELNMKETSSDAGEPDHKEPKKKVVESPLLIVQQPILDVLPDLDCPELTMEDLTLDEKSLSISDDENEDLRKFGDLADLNLPENDVIDFETYKKNLDLPKCYARARSFSEPCGTERYIAYNSLENAFNQQAWVGELPVQVSPVMTSIRTKGSTDSEDVTEANSDYPNQPGFQTFDLNEPGQIPVEKINERKPMVFVGGVSASTTSIELVTELKSQGFNVTVLPRIRYGVSFGFCPDLVLSSIEEVENLLALGRVWVKDRWVDVRPYIPKDTEQIGAPVMSSPVQINPSSPPEVINIEDAIGDNVAYISREDLLNTSVPSSPASFSSGNEETLSPQFLTLNPYFQMAPGFQTLPFSPNHLAQMTPYFSGFFPNQNQGEFVFQTKHFQPPSPPHHYHEQIQHPITAVDANFTFTSV